MSELPWTLDTKDRSFQFGRLLAVMERVEQDYYNKMREDRQTTAIKSISEFRQHPFTIYERINRHLNQAYLPRVTGSQRRRYMRMKDEIIGIISGFPKDDLDRPLDDIYLLGYDLQHAAFYQSKKDNNQSGSNDPLSDDEDDVN